MSAPRTYFEDHYVFSAVVAGCMGALATVFGVLTIANFVDVHIRDGIVGSALTAMFAMSALYLWDCAKKGVGYEEEAGGPTETRLECWVGRHALISAAPMVVGLAIVSASVIQGIIIRQDVLAKGYTWGDMVGAWLLLCVIGLWCMLGIRYVFHLRRAVADKEECE